ncbi:hypothetical protein CHS0354_027117 [Potamilus streckersoni]|uniref:Uncharacterized protein n=1 Tax=Potamilus streckersoni TaxID=2493646 RepID=A0AAE0VME6_9BIVA|nr:hypothetical protein CHS0354_027117 [Potamilus streckersoni]
MSNYPPPFYSDNRSHEGSESDTASRYEMQSWPAHYSSQASITPSYRSYLSTYTPSQASFFILPVVMESPDTERKPADNWGFAFCSLLCNPVFGVFAILLAEMSKNFFLQKDYSKAAKYGGYAKGVAMGGIIVMLIVLSLIIAQVIHYRLKFNY